MVYLGIASLQVSTNGAKQDDSALSDLVISSIVGLCCSL